MPLRVIYTECSIAPWFEVASMLQAKHGWQPVYWTAADYCEPEIRKRFPNIIFHFNYEACRGIPPKACANLPRPPIDEKLLEELAVYESQVLRMMDRMDPDDSFSYWQRVRLYRHHIGYSLALLDHLKPDIIVFPGAPHLIYDYVLYAICRKRGIRTVLLKETYIGGLLYPQNVFETASPEVLRIYNQLLSSNDGNVALSEPSRQYLDRLKGDYETARPYYLTQFLQAAAGTMAPQPKETESSKTFLLRDCLNLFWRVTTLPRRCLLSLYFAFLFLCALIGRHKRFNHHKMKAVLDSTFYLYDTIEYSGNFILEPLPANYLVRWGEDPQDRNGMTGIEFRLYTVLSNRRKQAFASLYESLTKAPDFNKPFIFVALNYQPEQTTSPEGGAFADQTVMVQMLSALLPTGWELYVKEHPVQFHPKVTGETCRWRQFYRDLAALPNVRLISLSYKPFELTDRAVAVAAVNSTAGWEAVVRGKPALVFGHVWYEGCEGVFYTPTEESCRVALARIQAGFKPDFQRIRLFVRALELAGTRGCTLPHALVAAGLTMEQSAEGIANALVRGAAGFDHDAGSTTKAA